MIRVLLGIVVAALVIALAWFVSALPGDATLRLGDVVVQAAAPILVLAAAILFVVLYAIIRLLGLLWRLPRIAARRRERRRRQRGDVAITGVLVALAAGEGAEARRAAGRARRLLGETPQTLLLAAEAGRLAGRPEEAERLFHTLAASKDGRFLGLRGLLRQAMAREDWAEAAELARRAEAAHPGAIWLRSERAQLALRTGAWREAVPLIPPGPSRAALAAAAAAAEPDPDLGARMAKDAFETAPDLAPAAIFYAGRLRTAGREARAQSVLRRAWAARPQPDLAAFALAPLAEATLRLDAGTKLVRDVPAHPESLLLLARLALDAGEPGRARQYAEAAEAAGLRQRRLYVLLADIAATEAAAGRPDAAELQRAALTAATGAAPDPVWRCGQCGSVQSAWSPVCGVCHAPGRIAWGGEPPQVVEPQLIEPRITEPRTAGADTDGSQAVATQTIGAPTTGARAASA